MPPGCCFIVGDNTGSPIDSLVQRPAAATKALARAVRGAQAVMAAEFWWIASLLNCVRFRLISRSRRVRPNDRDLVYLSVRARCLSVGSAARDDSRAAQLTGTAMGRQRQFAEQGIGHWLAIVMPARTLTPTSVDEGPVPARAADRRADH